MTFAGILWLGSFRLALLLILALAFVRGAGPERIVAILFVWALGGSWLALRHHHQFASFEAPLASVDLGVLLVLWLVSMYAMRWWPMIATAAQLVTCAGHLGRLLDPAVSPLTYARVAAFSAWPTLIAIGVPLVLRSRRTGAELSWRPSLPLGALLILRRLRLD